jgi:hypothetical protein
VLSLPKHRPSSFKEERRFDRLRASGDGKRG